MVRRLVSITSAHSKSAQRDAEDQQHPRNAAPCITPLTKHPVAPPVESDRISDGFLLFQDRHLALQVLSKPQTALESHERSMTMKTIFLVWNEAGNECVGFEDRLDADYAATGFDEGNGGFNFGRDVSRSVR